MKTIGFQKTLLLCVSLAAGEAFTESLAPETGTLRAPKSRFAAASAANFTAPPQNLKTFKFPRCAISLRSLIPKGPKIEKIHSRLKFSILTCRIPHKNSGLVGGSLEFSISLELFNAGGRS